MLDTTYSTPVALLLSAPGYKRTILVVLGCMRAEDVKTSIIVIVVQYIKNSIKNVQEKLFLALMVVFYSFLVCFILMALYSW